MQGFKTNSGLRVVAAAMLLLQPAAVLGAAMPAPSRTILERAAASPVPTDVSLGISGFFLKGGRSTTFQIIDSASTVNSGTCELPGSFAAQNGSAAPIELNAFQPCDPTTYQWELVDWSSVADFTLEFSHTIEEGTPNEVRVKEGSKEYGCVDPANVPCTWASHTVTASSTPAPAGWEGDKVLS